MKKITATLILCVLATTVFAQDETRLVNSADKLREWCLLKNFDAKPYAESVNKFIYVDKKPVKEYAAMYGKLSLAWYRIVVSQPYKELSDWYSIPLTGDEIKNVDYDDLFKVLSAASDNNNLMDSCYLLCAYQTGDYYYNKNEFEKAVGAYNLALDCASKMYKTDYPKECFRAYKMLGFAYFKLRDEKAGFMQEMAAVSLPVNYPNRQKNYYKNIYSAGSTYAIFENYKKADSCYSISEQYVMQNETDAKKAQFLERRGESAKNINQITQAAQFYENANQYQSDPSKKMENLTQIAEIWDKNGNKSNYLNAIGRGVFLLENDYNNIDKYQTLLFVKCCNSENYNTATYMDRLTSFVENNYKSNDVISLATKSYVYYAAGKYKRANYYKNEALKLHEATYDDRNTEKNKERTAISTLLSTMNDATKMLQYQQQTLDRVARLVGKDHQMYKKYSLTIASLNMMYNNDYAGAEKLAESLLSTSVNESETYYDALSLKAHVSLYKGQTLAASQLYRKIANAKTNLREKFQYLLYDANFTCLEIMTRNKNKNDRQGCEELIADMQNSVNQMSEIAEKTFPKTSKDYFDYLSTKGKLMYLKNDRAELSDIISQMEAIIEHTENLEVKKKEKTDLSSLYAWYGNFEKALSLIKDSDPESGINNRNKYNNYLMFASLNFGAGNTSKAIDYYEKGVAVGMENLRKVFPLLTEAERSAYWDLFKQAFYNAGKYATVFNKETPFNGSLYNLALYSKGLLMRSQNAIIQKLKALGDSTILEDIQVIKQLRMSASNGKSGTEKQAILQADAEKLEKELLQKCAQKGYNLESEFANYLQVKDKLTEKDAAVEFILYFDKDTIGHYGALILRKNYKYPVFVHISEKEKFESSLSFDSKTSQMVWNPLIPFFNGVENIFFAPIGAIHKFAIEYLPFENSGFIANKYNIYRVSSTSEIVKRDQKQSFNYKKAIIYGGINYDTDNTTLQEVVDYQATRGNSGNARLTYLKGTLEEAQNITDVFNVKKIKTVFYEGWFATEESFKKLSGSDNGIIHLGTHGFCKVTDSDLRLAVTGGNAQVDGDYAMYNSGLFFAGANNTLRGDNNSELEDGVLTSKEVSVLDFSKTDLITLSACVTGDGDITGEGVFGVQRGFKLAGANALVMSCWAVSDASTQLLMNTFYRNLISGKSKRESMLDAVETVKSNPKFADSRYWAAFILLDGLN